MHWYPHFPCILSDVIEIQCEVSAHYAAEYLWVSGLCGGGGWASRQGSFIPQYSSNSGLCASQIPFWQSGKEKSLLALPVTEICSFVCPAHRLFMWTKCWWKWIVYSAVTEMGLDRLRNACDAAVEGTRMWPEKWWSFLRNEKRLVLQDLWTLPFSKQVKVASTLDMCSRAGWK
jgi:hypothetical protein